MFSIASVAGFSLLGLAGAISTVTVSVNTGECPATYSSSSVSSSSGTATVPASSSSVYTRDPCPAPAGSAYTGQDGGEYQLYCNSAILGNDILAVDATSLSDCMAQCDVYTPSNVDTQSGGSYCVAVSYTAAPVISGNCQFKSDVTNIQLLTSSEDSAKLARFALSPSISSSISSVLASSMTATSSQTSGTQSGSSTTQSTSTTSTGQGSASSSTTTSSISGSTASSTDTSSAASAAATSTTASSAAASGTAAPCPCPTSNNQTVDDSLGYDYEVTCDESFSLLQGPGSSFAATFDDCMLACDAYVDQTTYDACTAAAYMPGDPENGLNCFLTTDSDPDMIFESGACLAMVPAGEP